MSEVLTFSQLCDSDCPKGGKHRVFLNLSGGEHPAECLKCGAFTDDVPAEEYDNL